MRRMLPLRQPKREVGPERPINAIQHGVYIGDDPELHHQTALISRKGPGWVIQTDVLTSACSHGWWYFPYEDWRLT